LVNVPVGVAALLIGRRMLPESRTPTAPAIDVAGALSLATTIALVLLPLTLGRASGWPVWTWLSLAAAPAAAGYFVASQRRFERSGRVPLVPLSLLEVRYARLGLTAMLLFATCVGGFLFSLTMVLQAGHDYSALKSGLTMVPSAVAFFLVALGTRRLTARFGDRLVAGGAVVFAVGLAGFAVVVVASGGHLNAVAASAPLVVLGLGWAAAIVPLMGVVLSGLPAQRAGLAGGVLSTALQVGLAAGASIVGTVLFSVAGSGVDVGRWRDATLVMVAVECGLALATAVTVLRLRAAAASR
jgi:hypothetical protein